MTNIFIVIYYKSSIILQCFTVLYSALQYFNYLKMSKVKKIILSCTNKTNLDRLWHSFQSKGFDGYASDGTFNYLKTKNTDLVKNLQHTSKLTSFNQLLNGRVKTLHPNIFAGLLGDPNDEEDANDLVNNNINCFDVMCVNLYPVENIIQNYKYKKDIVYTSSNMKINPVLQNMDIGGNAMIRAACKNYQNLLCIVDPNDYDDVIYNYDDLTVTDRMYFAGKAMDYVTRQDMLLSQYFNADHIQYKRYTSYRTLKYGCNPHQKAKLFTVSDSVYEDQEMPFKILNGEPSYINILDSLYSWSCVTDISNTVSKRYRKVHAAASFKHNAPAGVAMNQNEVKLLCEMTYTTENDNITIQEARECDPLSSFGDFIAYSGHVSLNTALYLKGQVSDGIIAHSFDCEALEILKKKKNGKYIVLQGDRDIANVNSHMNNNYEFRELNGVALAQERNVLRPEINIEDNNTYLDAILATMTLKYTPSNSVTFAIDGKVIGIGCGQQNRVACISLAGKKAEKWLMCNKKFIESKILTGKAKLTMSSDGFLPFEDNIEEALKYDVDVIIQPGGSIRDDKIYKLCEENGIEMIHTGQRVFTH